MLFVLYVQKAWVAQPYYIFVKISLFNPLAFNYHKSGVKILIMGTTIEFTNISDINQVCTLFSS
jgi:hypothetical protein